MNPPRIALVTGAGGILGPSICQALRQKGWLVAATDSTAENLDRARVLCGGIFWDHDVAGNIASEDFCKALVSDVGKRVGDIGLLVNNAAIPGRGSLDEITEEAALSIFRVNVLAPLWLTRACRGSLLRRRGSVINISSAQTQAFCEKTHLYVASKAALEQLTRSMASEFLGRGVRVNAIRVGRVPGAAFLRKWTDTLPPEAARELIERVMPVHLENARESMGPDAIGSPDGIASIVAFLASEDSRFINGEILTADGGFLATSRDWEGQQLPGSNRANEAAEAWVAEWRKS